MMKRAWLEISIGTLEFLYPKSDSSKSDFETKSQEYELREAFNTVLEILKKELSEY